MFTVPLPSKWISASAAIPAFRKCLPSTGYTRYNSVSGFIAIRLKYLLDTENTTPYDDFEQLLNVNPL
jgi:hypothetical protein